MIIVIKPVAREHHYCSAGLAIPCYTDRWQVEKKAL
jgi:hypothetical protein